MNFPISWVVLFLILIPGSSIIGIITNAIFIAAFRSGREMGTTDMLFFSLAVSDLIYDIFSFLGSIFRFIRYIDVDTGSDLTVIMLPVFHQCVYGIPNSIAKYLMTVLSIERAVAVLWPSYFHLHWTKRKALYTIISGATIVAITALPYSLQMEASPKDNITDIGPGVLETKYTDMFYNNRELFQLHSTLYQVLFGIVPILVVLVMNIATIFGLFRMERKVGQLKLPRSQRIATERATVQAMPTETETIQAMSTGIETIQAMSTGIETIQAMSTGIETIQAMSSEIETIQAMSADSLVVNLGQNDEPSIYLGQNDESSSTERQDTSTTEEVKYNVGNSVCQGAELSVVGGNTSSFHDGIDHRNESPKYEHNPCVPGTTSTEIVREDINVDRRDTQHRRSSRYSKTSAKEEQKKDEPRYSKEQKKRSITLVMVSSVFLILNLPSKLLVVIIQGSSDSTYEEEASLQLEVYIGIVLFCELLNTIINSIIFVIRSDKYRTYVNHNMRCCYEGNVLHRRTTRSGKESSLINARSIAL